MPCFAWLLHYLCRKYAANDNGCPNLSPFAIAAKYLITMRILALSVIFILSAILTCAHAQSEGSLVINQDPRLEKLLINDDKTPTKGDSTSMEMPGFRVQIYSNNNPRKAKTEAFDIEKTFKSEYPDVNVYVTYSAPFWKVRVGDFTNYFEALSFARELSKSKSKINGEIFVMEEDFVKPVYIDLSSDSIPNKQKSGGLSDKLSQPSKQKYYHY